MLTTELPRWDVPTATVIWWSVTRLCFIAFSHQYLPNFSFQSHRLQQRCEAKNHKTAKLPQQGYEATTSRSRVIYVSYLATKLNPFSNKPLYLHVYSISFSFLKYCQKRRNCSQRAISPFFYSVFYPFKKNSAIFIKFIIVVCKLFWFGKV